MNQNECVPSPSPEEVPPEVARNSSLWPLPNRDYASARANFDSNISSDTIDRLETVWTFDLIGENTDILPRICFK